jgi:hypothetical protein
MIVHDIPESEWASRWPEVRLDEFKYLPEMDVAQMTALNSLTYAAERQNSWLHRINSDYRPDDRATGMHRAGKATDIVFFLHTPGDVPIWEQFEFTTEQHIFTRVGFYPFWHAPGLHVDTKNEILYWWQDKSLKYHYAKIPAELRGWNATV